MCIRDRCVWAVVNLDISDPESFIPLCQMKLEAVDFLLGRFDSIGHFLQLFYLGFQRGDLILCFGQLFPPFLAVAFRSKQAQFDLGMLVLPLLDFNRRGLELFLLILQLTLELLDFGLRMPPLTVAMARLVLRGLQLRLELLAFLFQFGDAGFLLIDALSSVSEILELAELIVQLFDAHFQLGDCVTCVQTGSFCFCLI